MIKSIGQGINSIVLACLLLTILSLNLIQVQGQPLWLLCRNIILAGLGAPTPGVVIQGDNAPPSVECDNNTGVCRVVER